MTIAQFARLACAFFRQLCCSLFKLIGALGPFTLYSHQETGNLWTYQRDNQVAHWCRRHQIHWHQYAQHAVRRGRRKHRINQSKTSQSGHQPSANQPSEDWHQHWQQWSQQALLPVPARLQFANVAPLLASTLRPNMLSAATLPAQVCDDEFTCPGRQSGGRQAGLALPDSFIGQRSQHYQASISAPQTAQHGCSRLSAHLAYGTISLREVITRLDLTLQQQPDQHSRRHLAAFRSRLVWHCYFMQKLENNPTAGLVNLNRQYDVLQRPWDAQRFAAWCQGNTGWPMVDACMRYLIYHGWLNFRMRAMLVSVACYTLKLPWQPVSEYLARLFVDFEPGIHYPQIQMQSGTTGQQVLRIYNPVKQAQELDPHGAFVRCWLPELANVSTMWIFEPWLMPKEMKLRSGAQHYPMPQVDFSQSHRAAKDEISQLRSTAMSPRPPTHQHRIRPNQSV